MSDLRPILARIEAILPQLATAAQVAELRGDFDGKLARFAGAFDSKFERLAGEVDSKFERFSGEFDSKFDAEQARFAGGFNARLERLTGRVESLPTTWQMMTAIIARQVALAGLCGAAVFGAARLLGHL
jgi:uncharacterized protein YceH (UPF0502 family)